MSNTEVYDKLCKVFQIQKLQTFDEYLDRMDAEASASKGKKKAAKAEKTIDSIPLEIPGGDL